MPLTDNACRTATLGKKSDGGGLYLNVRSPTSHLWQMAYRFEGKQKTLSFGAYPVVTLAAARARRAEAKAILARGIDPITVKPGTELPGEVPAERQFQTVAWAWFDSVEPGYKPNPRKSLHSMLARLIVPPFARLDIAAITKPEVLAALRTIEVENGPPTARRCKQFIARIFARGEDDGLCTNNPAASIRRDSLKPIPRAIKRARVGQNEIPALLYDISRHPDERLRLGLLLTFHTALRLREITESPFDNSGVSDPAQERG